jgi:hypothetical protein
VKSTAKSRDLFQLSLRHFSVYFPRSILFAFLDMRPASKGLPQNALKSNEKPHDRRAVAKSAVRF